MYPTAETLEREISYLLSNQSLSGSLDIDPMNVVSVDPGTYSFRLRKNHDERLTLIESDSPTAVEHISTEEELKTFLKKPSSKRYSSRL